MYEQIQPLYILKLDTVDQRGSNSFFLIELFVFQLNKIFFLERKSVYLQTDYTNLKHLCSELEAALEELKAPYVRRVERNLWTHTSSLHSPILFLLQLIGCLYFANKWRFHLIVDKWSLNLFSVLNVEKSIMFNELKSNEIFVTSNTQQWSLLLWFQSSDILGWEGNIFLSEKKKYWHKDPTLLITFFLRIHCENKPHK